MLRNEPASWAIWCCFLSCAWGSIASSGQPMVRLHLMLRTLPTAARTHCTHCAAAGVRSFRPIRTLCTSSAVIHDRSSCTLCNPSALADAAPSAPLRLIALLLRILTHSASTTLLTLVTLPAVLTHTASAQGLLFLMQKCLHPLFSGSFFPSTTWECSML